MLFSRLDFVCAVILVAGGALAVVHQLWFTCGGSSENEWLRGAASENTAEERRDHDASEQLALPSSSNDLVS